MRFLASSSTVRQPVFFTAGENKKLEYWYYIQCLNVCMHLYQTFPGHAGGAARTARGRLGMQIKTRL